MAFVSHATMGPKPLVINRRCLRQPAPKSPRELQPAIDLRVEHDLQLQRQRRVQVRGRGQV